VAQVVGAGFSKSQQTGEVATLVKLIRVAMLAPVVLLIAIFVSLRFSNTTGFGHSASLVPGFLVCFALFATVNSLDGIPHTVTDIATNLSQWCLLIAIAAVGMKTSLKSIFEVGGQAIAIIVGETIFIGTIMILAISQ